MDEEALIRRTVDLLQTAEKVIDELRSRRPEDDISGAGADFEPPSLVEKVAIAQFVSQVAAAERLIAQEDDARKAAEGVARTAMEEVREQARARILALKAGLPPPPAAPQAPSPPDSQTMPALFPLVTVVRADEGIEVEVLVGDEQIVFECKTPQELSEAFHKTADLLAAAVLSKNT